MTRPNPRQPRQKRSPECPKCGHSYCTQIDSAWANDEEINLRLYTCPNEECGSFISAEIVLPGPVRSLMQFDEHRRLVRRDYARRHNNYYGTPPRGSTIVESARIVYSARIIPAKRLRTINRSRKEQPA